MSQNKLQGKYTSIGGQAVIEGVMMRSPHYLAIAVRKPDFKIVIKEMRWEGWSDKWPVLKKPFLRGVVTLLESMINGIQALTYSANVAVINEVKQALHADHTTEALHADQKTEAMSSFAIFGSIALAFVMGMVLFVAAPHFLTALLGRAGLYGGGVNNPLFHLLDGVIKVVFLVSYIVGISMMKDIYRVFQYHGAEHKSIYAFESGLELTVENARKFKRLHPRCGTSFLLFLLIISIIIFAGVFPAFGLTQLSDNKILNHALMVVIKIFLMFPVAAISYEFIRYTARKMDNVVCRILIVPGLMLQQLTTREPTDEQLEVALASLKTVLMLEKKGDKNLTGSKEIEIASINEISSVPANLNEFAEA